MDQFLTVRFAKKTELHFQEQKQVQDWDLDISKIGEGGHPPLPLDNFLDHPPKKWGGGSPFEDFVEETPYLTVRFAQPHW